MTDPAKAAPMREDVTRLISELRNPWQHNPTADTRGPLPDWAGVLLSRAATAIEDDGADHDLIVLLSEVEMHLKSVRIFISTREKIHPVGLDLHDEVLANVTARLEEQRHRLAHTARPDAGDGTWGPITEWEMIDRLRDEEADSVTVLCDNPDGSPNNAVECCGFWTGFADRRFEGATIREALTAAVAAKDEALKVGYPPMSYPDAGDAIEAVQWALDEIEGRTQYPGSDIASPEQQRQNCVDKLTDALSVLRGVPAQAARRPDAGEDEVERVARAIAGELIDRSVEGHTLLTVDCAELARAALAAMREGVDRGMVERLREAIGQILIAVEDEAYKVTVGQQPCRHTAALNEIHEIAYAALSPEQPR